MLISNTLLNLNFYKEFG